MEKRKVGRPKGEKYSERHQFRFDPLMYAAVVKAAEQSGINVSEWIRGAIEDRLSGDLVRLTNLLSQSEFTGRFEIAPEPLNGPSWITGDFSAPQSQDKSGYDAIKTKLSGL